MVILLSAYITSGVGQHRGKDGRWTSVHRLTEGDPERPAAPLVPEVPWHGGSLRPFDAIHSIDRFHLWQFWKCHENQTIDWRPLQQLSHEDISELLRRVLLLSYSVFRQVWVYYWLGEKKRETQRRGYTLGKGKEQKCVYFLFFPCGVLGVFCVSDHV